MACKPFLVPLKNPKAKRLLERKAVTIAAAFRFQDGVILCADSEYTHTTRKLPGRKIIPVNAWKQDMNLAIAFAGTMAVAKMAVQQFQEHLAALPPTPLSEAQFASELNTFLREFHEKNIFHHPRYLYSDGPNFWLIVAAQFKKSKAISLFSTSETAVNIEYDFCAVGSGQEFAEQVIGPLVYPTMRDKTRHQALLLATHTLYQVKKYVSGCGGSSNFMLIGNNGTFYPLTSFEILAPSAYSETFERIIADLFYAAADMDMDDPQVSAMLQLTDTRIKEIREEQRHERERMKQLWDMMNRKPKG